MSSHLVSSSFMEQKVNNNTVSAQPLTTPSMPLPQVMMKMNVGNNNNNGGTTTTTITTAATTMTTTQGSGGGGGQGSFDLFGKKKRGRPRKYDSDGNLRLTYQKATPPPPPPGFALSPTSSHSEFSSKRGRGRPAGSNNWQLFAASFGEAFANTAGGDFTPHVVTVYTGEDVAGKIFSFTQKGPRGICILSANGPISNVAIRQPGSSGGILTYEGRFEILSLSGSFTVSEDSGIRSRNGGLSVSLAGPDGRVIGGSVAGPLTAAGPIQVVMGSFMPNGYNNIHKRKYHRREHKLVSPISGGPDSVAAAKPISQVNPDGENLLITTSQLQEQSQRESVSVTSGDTQNLDATPNVATWNGSEEFSDQRISPDINITLPDE